VQARLARVLRDREALLARMASPSRWTSRPIAGVARGFDSAVQEGRVRDDLFRRLSVIRLEMPPLRGRREDIPALEQHHGRISEAAKALGSQRTNLYRKVRSLRVKGDRRS
jgi:DNA-binding NtrC family response regulator